MAGGERGALSCVSPGPQWGRSGVAPRPAQVPWPCPWAGHRRNGSAKVVFCAFGLPVLSLSIRAVTDEQRDHIIFLANKTASSGSSPICVLLDPPILGSG